VHASSVHDKGAFSLFRGVSEADVQKPTYKAFDKVASYYKADTSVPESFDSGRTQAISAFLDEVLKTRVMQAARSFLNKYGSNKTCVCESCSPDFAPAASNATFKEYLNRIWFTTYSRGARDSSSGFEHVYRYDIDTNANGERELKGLHYWYTLWRLEAAGKIDYAGYIQKREVGNVGRTQARYCSE
jgi:hypothetical protein